MLIALQTDGAIGNSTLHNGNIILYYHSKEKVDESRDLLKIPLVTGNVVMSCS